MLPDSNHPLPLYAQVETAIADDIATGRFSPGDRLPTEDDMIARYSVSRITVRRAIQNLAGRGIVEVRRGRGTFVAQPRLVQELTELSGFVEDMRVLGREPSARVVDAGILAADADVAHHLGVPVGTDVMRILRVRLADRVAVSFDETFLPRWLGEKVISHNLEVEPIFTLLEDRYDVPLIEATYRLEATSASDMIARELGVTAGSPLMRIERTSFTTDSVPVDFERLSYRGDLIRFTTRLQRRPTS